MRNTFSEALYRAASANPDIYIVVADISPAGSMAKFSQQYPDRFINVGGPDCEIDSSGAQ